MSIMNRSPTGMELASGTSSHLQNLGFATLEEFVLPTHDLRVDVIALGRKGELWIVECKSSVRDFTSDSKWHRYIAYCDRFFFSVGHEFPTSILPDGTGMQETRNRIRSQRRIKTVSQPAILIRVGFHSRVDIISRLSPSSRKTSHAATVGPMCSIISI